MGGGVRDGCVCRLGSGRRRAGVERGIEKRECNRGGGGRARGRVGGVGDVRAVRFLGIGSGLKITRRRIVRLHGFRRHPCQIAMGRNWCIGLVEVGVDQRFAGEAEYRGAVGEEIDILRSDDVHALKRGLSVAVCLRLIWR